LVVPIWNFRRVLAAGKRRDIRRAAPLPRAGSLGYGADRRA
jgi:hypothetical protein